MLRVLMRKCYHCSKVHERGIEIRSYFSTHGSKKIEIDCGGKSKLEISSGRLARLADGAAVARLGETSVMTTVVSKGKPSQQNFLPLTVDYRQKAAAAGRIPTNYLRRELGATEREILVGRMIDRSLRPLFSKGYNVETGINCNLLSVDGVHDPEVLSINAASAALSLSDVPWGPPVGAVRLGYINGQTVLNPTRRELARSELNLVVAGTTEGLATMLEGEAKCLDHQSFIGAIKLGLEHCAKIAQSIETMAKEAGKPKRELSSLTESQPDAELTSLVDTLCAAKLRCLYTDYSLDKLSRDQKMFQIRDDMINQVRSIKPEIDSTILGDLFSNLSKHIVRNLIFEENLRVDGRSSTDIRPISCDVNLHAPLHGSALFQRGQTQVLCTVALDSLQSALKLDPITAITGGVKEKNFMLHYEFPGYATGDLGRGGSRREMGHGALAEKALRQVLPSGTQFTVRLTSEVLESNGSSSMASICGGSLALLDAGIPLSEMASGVAMGLVTREGEQKVLTDIMGMEDFLGDMDFKFSATRSGVCALQADVKLPGISLDVIEQAVEGGVEANHRILDIMSACISTPRDYKDCWPVTKRLEVPPHKRGKFLGQAGLNVRKITQDTGVQIYPESEGVWQLFAPNPESMSEAEATIEDILTEEKIPELEFGGIYTGKVTEILDRGVMIQLHEQMNPVLLHNSQLSPRKIQHPSVLGLKVGQELQVKYYGRDPASGQMRLSRKALAISSAAAVKNLQNSAKRKDGEDSPPPPAPPSSSSTTIQPRKFVINENKADLYTPTFNQSDYIKLLEKNRSESTINKKDLFVKREPSSPNLQLSQLDSPAAAKAPAGLHVPEDDVTVNVDDYIKLVSSDYNKVPTVTNAPDQTENSKENIRIDESDDCDEAYYEIDRLFNKLMAINIEIKEATQRKENVDREWGYVKENLTSLERSSHTSRFLSQALNRDKVELCKKFSSQSKAINETLLLLTRQYKQIKDELELAKLSFIKAKNPVIADDLLQDAIKAHGLQDPEILEDLTLHNVLQSEGDVHQEEEVPQEERDPERYNKEVIADLVAETLKQSRFQNAEISDFKDNLSTRRHFDSSVFREKWGAPFSFLSSSPPKPQPKNDRPSTNSTAVDSVDRSHLPFEELDFDDVDPKDKLKFNLSGMHIERKRRLGRQKNNSVALNTYKSRLRKNAMEGMKVEMEKVLKRYDEGVTVPDVLKNEKVLMYVRKSHDDFQTMLRWMDELDNFNEARLKDVTEGTQIIYKNMLKNLQQLENNLKYLNYNKSGVEFIGRHLSRPDHPLVALALRNISKLESLYQQNLDFLSKDCSLHNRQEQDPSLVWEDYHRVRIQLKQIRKRLWEIELSEERIADLDDWREDHSPLFSNIQEQIDKVQSKIDSFTKVDIEKNWSTVEKDLHKLQGLKIEGLISWLTECESVPPWLYPELKDHLLDRCYRYKELDQKRRDIQNSWMTLRKKDETLDLSLDVLYSQIRSCMAKVKYACMENHRHRSELSIYSSWVDRFGSRLREPSRCQLQDMLKLAESKVNEVEEAVSLYVGVINSSQEYTRDAATVLDKMREEKRDIVRKIADAILYSCKEVKYEGVQILSYDEPS